MASTVSAWTRMVGSRFQLLSGGTSFLPSPCLAGYIVDSTHIELIETVGDNYVGVLGGMALGQGSSTGQFTANSITGSSYVFGVTGVDKYEPSRSPDLSSSIVAELWAVLLTGMTVPSRRHRALSPSPAPGPSTLPGV